MQASNTFGYFTLLEPDFEPTTSRSMKFKIVLNGSPKIMDFFINLFKVQAWVKLASNIKLASALQFLLFEIMTRGLLYLTDNGQT
jgi:hypothetical protein